MKGSGQRIQTRRDGTLQHGAVGSETRTVQRAVPRLFGIVPRHDAAEVRAHRRHAVGDAVDGADSLRCDAGLDVALTSTSGVFEPPVIGFAHPFVMFSPTLALIRIASTMPVSWRRFQLSYAPAQSVRPPNARCARTSADAAAFVIPHLSYPVATQMRSSPGSSGPAYGSASIDP